jgi:hypothetical protein
MGGWRFADLALLDSADSGSGGVVARTGTGYHVHTCSEDYRSREAGKMESFVCIGSWWCMYEK